MRWPIEMPWRAARRRFETLLDQFAITHHRLAELTAIVTRPAPPRARLSSMVNVLVIADGPEGQRITMGESGPVSGQRQFGLRAYMDLKNVSIVVFADPERVRVSRIAIGIQPLTASAGACPVAFVRDWPGSCELFVQCESDS